jgi:5-methylcytosine-specific restriction endonuclease McrA
MAPKSYIGLYGNVKILKEFCPHCQGYAFVLHGRLACCNREAVAEPRRFKRESEPEYARRRPSPDEQREILLFQNHCCIYCESPFGFIRYRHGRPLSLRIEWDHQIPFAYSRNNVTANFVAACHVCNRIKSSLCFPSIEEAAVYLSEQRQHRGYNF